MKLTRIAPRRVDEMSLVGRKDGVQNAPADISSPDFLRFGETSARSVVETQKLV